MSGGELTGYSRSIVGVLSGLLESTTGRDSRDLATRSGPGCLTNMPGEFAVENPQENSEDISPIPCANIRQAAKLAEAYVFCFCNLGANLNL